jgi:hypothetical protein
LDGLAIMTARQIKVNDRSILTAGLPTEFEEIVNQYVWNGFEAGATEISIDYDNSNTIGTIFSFTISDNGSGINYDNLEHSFGIILDSEKVRSKNSSLIHGGKGKGRFSFNHIAGKAIWNTTYPIADGSLKDYSITITKGKKDEFEPTDPINSSKNKIGTILELKSVENITAANFEDGNLEHALKLQFGWFLHLNRERKFKIIINGKELDCESIIKVSKRVVKSFIDEDDGDKSYKFIIDYIQWNEKIKEKNYYYFLNSKQDEVFKEYTSFNNTAGGAHGFYHGVYITSDFFDKFDDSSDENPSTQTNILASQCKSNSAYKALLVFLKEDLLKKRKAFYKESAHKAWQGFEDRKSLPTYRDNEIENIRKDSLKKVVENLYTIEPAIFVGLKPEQEKTMLGLMDIVLDTNEKDDVIKIVDSVVNDLTPEQRKDFVDTLDKIKMSNVIEVLKLVVSRQKVIEGLKRLVFDLKTYTNERDHIQKAVESSTWLFGEEFTAVTYDKTFEESLKQYTYILDGESSPSTASGAKNKRRMDIFLTRQRLVNDPIYANTTQLEENIIIELKRPDVTLSTTQMRQVQDYRNIIKKNPKFHSQMKLWKFFLVGNAVDDDVKAAYATNEIRGKRFLIDWQNDFEVYAMTWADIFDMYRIRNDFLIKKLDVNKETIQQELDALVSDKSTKEQPNKVTEMIQEEALVTV